MVWGLRDDAVTPQPSAQHTGRLRADGSVVLEARRRNSRVCYGAQVI